MVDKAVVDNRTPESNVVIMIPDVACSCECASISVSETPVSEKMHEAPERFRVALTTGGLRAVHAHPVLADDVGAGPREHRPLHPARLPSEQ